MALRKNSGGRTLRLNPIAGPILGEFLLGMTVAMVGLWLASHASDTEAASFGLGQQLLEALSVFLRVVAIGVGVGVTQALGASRPEAVRKTALAALAAGSWIGLGAMVAVELLPGHILDWMNAPEDVVPLAVPFLMALALVLPLEAWNLTMAATLRAHLLAKETLKVMLIMHCTHLLLAVLLMRGWGTWDGLGIVGYPIAMIVSRVWALVLHLNLWRDHLGLVPGRADWWRASWSNVLPLLKSGAPGAGMEMAYRLAFMVSLAATARLGTSALATHSYTLQLLRYVLLISMSIGWAVEIMVGRLVGAGALRQGDQLVRKAVRNGLIASGGLALVAALAAPWLLRIFTRDPQVVALAQTLLFVSIALETGRVFNLILNGALRATGDGRFPAVTGAVVILLVMGLGTYWMGRWFGLVGIWVVYAADEWIRGVILYARWRYRGWLSYARSSQQSLRKPEGSP